jgi:hypothetical protein
VFVGIGFVALLAMPFFLALPADAGAVLHGGAGARRSPAR